MLGVSTADVLAILPVRAGAVAVADVEKANDGGPRAGDDIIVNGQRIKGAPAASETRVHDPIHGRVPSQAGPKPFA